MKNKNKTNKQYVVLKLSMNLAVILSALYISIKVLRTATMSIFVLIILSFILLPSIIYILINKKSYSLEKIFIPALFLVSLEYYFFHDYEV